MKTLTNCTLQGQLLVGASACINCDEVSQGRVLITSPVQEIRETKYGYQIQTKNSIYDLNLARIPYEYEVSEKPVVMMDAPATFVSGCCRYSTGEPVISVKDSGKQLILFTKQYEFILNYR